MQLRHLLKKSGTDGNHIKQGVIEPLAVIVGKNCQLHPAFELLQTKQRNGVPDGPDLLTVDDRNRVDKQQQFIGQRRALLERLLDYRVFADSDGRMNLSVRDVHGGLLLVPQFTLAADTRKGTRASFTPAAPPEQGRLLFDYLLAEAHSSHPDVASGRFGAHMQVSSTNDGPVTFWLTAP